MKSLAQKIAAVIQTVKHPPQSGHHDYQGYDYSTRDDIFQSIRDELADRGVAPLMSCDCRGFKPAGKSSSGNEQFRAVVDVEVTLVDSETGETHTSTWSGEAVSSEDKGIQQAATQAIRFWAVNTFMLLDGSDEQMYGKSPTPQSGGGRSNQSDVHRDSPEPDPVEQMEGRLGELGFSDAQITAWNDWIADIHAQSSVDDVEESKLAKYAAKLESVSDEEARQRVMSSIGDDQAA